MRHFDIRQVGAARSDYANRKRRDPDRGPAGRSPSMSSVPVAGSTAPSLTRWIVTILVALSGCLRRT